MPATPAIDPTTRRGTPCDGAMLDTGTPCRRLLGHKGEHKPVRPLPAQGAPVATDTPVADDLLEDIEHSPADSRTPYQGCRCTACDESYGRP